MSSNLYKGFPTFYAKDAQTWRNWLQENHSRQKAVWLILFRKAAATPSVNYEEAVEQALCFGWIDSKPNKKDAESYYLFFSKRKAKSNWSKPNRDRIEKLEKLGILAEAGKKMVEIAKESGTWTALLEVEQLIIPQDLQVLFDQNKTAFENWKKFPPSTRRGILEWILNAKRSQTRQKRIQETAAKAALNIRANQYKS